MCGVVLSLAVLSAADTADDWLGVAEREFTDGLRRRDEGDRGSAAFRRAAWALAEARQRGANNAALWRQEGNAWLLAGDLPRAILAYRQGLRLRPGDADLRARLADARAEVTWPDGGRRPDDDPLPGWMPGVGPRERFLLASLGYSLGCLALTRWVMVRRGSWFAAAVTLYALALALAWSPLRAWLAGPANPIVVVRRDGVLLLQGDGADYPAWSEAPLNRGAEAELLHRRGAWLQVELPGGEVGWLPAESCLVAGDDSVTPFCP